MSKVIKCKVDIDSLQKAIDELKDYQDNFNTKLKAFMDALLENGLKVASDRASSFVGDSTPAMASKEYVVSDGDRLVANIYIVGKDVLFIEFGAGIAYNTGAQHPYADQFGYGVGTYPSKHPPNKAMRGYWFYREGGKLVKSFGTGATMPIYYASESMRNEAVSKALDVFRS